LLARIAVSSTYGAPYHRLAPTEKVARPSPASSSVAVAALTRDVGGSSGEARIGGLLVALVALTGMVALAARRR
jgi:hypothetical protein